MSKRILISGASGFIGANLARRLLSDGAEVHLLVRPSHQAWRLQEVLHDVHLHEADLEDRGAVLAAVQRVEPEWVFHLAAYGAYPSQADIERMVKTNVLGCISLLDACMETGFEAFINAGSSSEYGLKDHAATENEELEPNSHYAVTKAAATHYGQFTARARDAKVITVRLYSVYGPYEEPSRLIPTLIVHGLDGRLPTLVSPDTVRDFVFVEDAIEAMLRLAAAPSIPPGSVYNISSGAQTTLAEIVDLARKSMSVSVEPVWSTMPARSWDTKFWLGSPVKLRNAIGWRAQTGVEEGLLRTIKWFQMNPKWLEFYRARIRQPVNDASKMPSSSP